MKKFLKERHIPIVCVIIIITLLCVQYALGGWSAVFGMFIGVVVAVILVGSIGTACQGGNGDNGPDTD